MPVKGKVRDPGPKQCHPRIGSHRPAAGCLPIKVLETAGKSLGISGSGATLRKALEKKLEVEPEKEYSFLMALPGLSITEKHRLEKEYLRPRIPAEWLKDPDMWLDSTNIADVMNQYENVFPNFEFMGPFPIDFAAPNPYKGGAKKECLMNEICELRVQKARADGVTAIGIVYNLDPHFKSGSHWVANYVDLKNKRCLYFDSYGMKPPQQIEKFMSWLTTQDPDMELSYNARRLQFKNTECGMYCLYFIIRMLAGDKFIDFSRMKPADEDMLNLRHWLFSS
jgi:hypothetical protein